MEIDELLGLPAHPLIVHLPVVMVPLALTAAVLALWRPARRPALLAAAAFAMAGAVGALLAAASGEALEERVPETDAVEDHTDAGGAVRLPAVVFGLVAVGAAGAELARDRAPRAWLPLAAVAVTIATGGLATAAVARAGHTGATAVWEGTPTEDGAGAEDGDDDGADAEDGGDDSGRGRGRGRGGDD